MRECPGLNEDCTNPACKPGENCNRPAANWRCEGFPVDLFRRGNALCYNQPDLPDNLDTLPVDRIVHHDHSTSQSPGMLI